MSSTRFLLIDSRDRVAGSSSTTQFKIILPSAIHQVNKVKLLAVNMPNTTYNIRSTNNLLQFQRGATVYNATIPVGSYTQYTFPQAIVDAMVAVDSGNSYACVYDFTSFKLTITGTSAFTLLMLTSTCWYEMGFNQVNTTALTSQIAPNTIQLGLPLSVYVEVPELSMGMSSSRLNDRCTWVIPISVNSGSIQYFADNSNYEQVYTYREGRTLYELNVKVRWRNGELLDLNGADWQFHLLLE